MRSLTRNKKSTERNDGETEIRVINRPALAGFVVYVIYYM
jgi:hypothetical protein